VTLAILLFLMLICIIYIIFAFTKPRQEMILNLNGKKENEILFPDFEREDIKLFIKQCEEVGISKNIAKDFILSMYNTMYFKSEPLMPNLNESRYENWELDDDIEDFINYIFEKYNIEKVRWNQKEILEIDTFLDILNYLSKKIKMAT